jgi:hypothetical protein
LSLAGVLETVVGIGLIVDPGGAWSVLLASTVEAPGAVIGRICGGALLSIGIACWCARKTSSTPTSRGIGWAYFIFSVVASATLAHFAAASGGSAPPTVAAALVHGAFGAAMLAALLMPTHGPHG